MNGGGAQLPPSPVANHTNNIINSNCNNDISNDSSNINNITKMCMEEQRPPTTMLAIQGAMGQGTPTS